MSALPRTHRFKVDEHELASQAGVFEPEERIEIVIGKVVDS